MNSVKSNIIKLQGVADSCIGGRPENQDDLGFQDTPIGFLFIVCDGMGGGPGGRTASLTVKEEIAKVLLGCNNTMNREKALRMAVSQANDALLAKMKTNPNLEGMGSTFVAILVNEQSALIAHAGDSRCYHIRGSRLLHCSNDHSLVGELVRKKVMTEEEARISPQSNVISRGLGCLTNNTPDITETSYRKGDKFILCTDGTWGAMPKKELLKHFTSKYSNNLILSNLIAEVERYGNANGGTHDNHSTAIIEMQQDSLLKIKSKNYKNIYIYVAIALSAILLTIGLLYYFSSNRSENSNAVYITETGSTESGSTYEALPETVKYDPPITIKNDDIAYTIAKQTINYEATWENARMLMQKACNRFDSIIKCSDTSQEKTITQKEVLLDEAVGYLHEVNKFGLSEIEQTINELIGFIDAHKNRILLVRQCDNKYVSTNDAKITLKDAKDIAEKALVTSQEKANKEKR